MPIPLEKLLAPVAPEKPCGDDVSYDPAFQELETLIAGTPATQFSTGEPPDWRAVRERALDLAGRSKHLRLGLALTAAQLRQEGLSALPQALALFGGWVENFWEPLYPRLDPDDNNDPTERLNIIAGLATPIAQAGDVFQIVEGIRTAPLSSSMRMGKFSYADALRSQAGTEGAPSSAAVEAAFRDTAPEALTATHGFVVESLALLKQLEAKLEVAAGADRVPDFEVLSKTLQELRKYLGPFLPADAAAAADAADSAASSQSPASGGGPAAPRTGGQIAGAVETREDVMKTIDLICAYYAQWEPASPVPLLLQRAKRMVTMDFMAIMEDFAPDALGQVNLIAGIKPS